MENTRQYPVGIQDFKEIRDTNGLYIDKTEYVYRMTHSLAKYYFLSRPRRFGKSLLVSTLRYYFEGCKDLFEGLAIDKMETAWEKYPVLRFDLSKAKDLNMEQLVGSIGLQIAQYEDVYGADSREITLGDRLGGLIMRACSKTGKKVVLLIDEYDAPILDVAHDKVKMTEVRKIMANFYSSLKGSGEYLRFVFLTGITRYSQLGLFSGLNNIKNISMREDYAAVCGITKTELTEQMAVDIDMLAVKLGKTSEETLEMLVNEYDGYHFTWPSEDIFNPFSLLNAFEDGNIMDYWFESGTSAHAIELLRQYGVEPTSVVRIETDINEFNVPLEESSNYVPLMYQSGYLTIKDYNANDKIYTLDVPNEEVRVGLVRCLLPHYLPKNMNPGMGGRINKMRSALNKEDIKATMEYVKEILKMIPYTNYAGYEGDYQRLMFCFFTLAGAECRLEEHTSAGRMDIVMRTRHRIYVIELKLDNSAEEAMEQIEDKDYASYFAGYTLPVTKVGVNIDSKMRTISQVIVM